MSRTVMIATAIAVVVGIGAGYWLVSGKSRTTVPGGLVNNPAVGAGNVNTGIKTGPSNIQTGIPGK